MEIDPVLRRLGVRVSEKLIKALLGVVSILTMYKAYIYISYYRITQLFPIETSTRFS